MLMLLIVVALAVALDSAVLGILAALMLLAVVMEALGAGQADVIEIDPSSPQRAAERRRCA